MELHLTSKIALVTASSKGLGKAAAMSLAKEGATVIVCSRNKKEIELAADEIRRVSGAEVLPVVADVSRAEQIGMLFETIRERFGTLHVLVNNAGGPPTGDILTMTDEEWRQGYELTLMSMVRLTREALPLMIKQQWGRIITITSITGKQPVNDLLISSALRPGIHGLSKVLSNKYAKDNITVNTICPGFIHTERQQDLMQQRSATKNITPEEYMAEIVRDIPAGRMGKLAEVGDVIAFLSSENASYISGVNLLVDGGLARGIH
ncbi:MAG: SDR family oxidoreductase [Bacteroidales bacterium]|nr:SDR family oxidoreductase [Bacteroidales bacterium]